jgi:Domain of unknown function (DUF4159)
MTGMRSPAAGTRPNSARTRRLTVVIAAGVLLVASVSAAQFRGFRGFGQGIRMATPESFDGTFQFCRVLFRNAPYGDGGGWGVDYPRADQNISTRLSELTRTTVGRDSSGEPNHLVVRLTDPELFHCPFVMMTEPGGAYFDQSEAARLQEYLLKGGFLWVDDFWGTRAWANWSDQIGKALPPGLYPIKELTLDHPIFHVLYAVNHVAQIPSINSWFGMGGSTSERGADSAVPHVRAITDDTGRIIVLMTFNTDFGDSWEREGDNKAYFKAFGPDGYAFGINVLIYAMTH